MSIIKIEDSKKWINGLVAIFSVIAGFVLTKFIEQMSQWFDLETKIPNLPILSQVAGVIFGIVIFVGILNYKQSSTYLNEVFNELVKVTWPTKDATTKITVGLIISLIVVSTIFVFIDYIFKTLLSYVY